MSTPEGQLRPPLPWTAHDSCQVCRDPRTETMSLYGGRRCAKHPDKFDQNVALRLRIDGWKDTADAYRDYYGDRDA